MLFTVGAAFALVICLQVPADERLRAERLAREGQTADAMAIFGRIVEQDPRDDEARLWLAQLALRLGRTSEAETGFRAVKDVVSGDRYENALRFFTRSSQILRSSGIRCKSSFSI